MFVCPLAKYVLTSDEYVDEYVDQSRGDSKI